MCHVTLWLTPVLPQVSFGDTVLNPPPPPLECHVLFEWPLISDSLHITLSVITLSVPTSFQCPSDRKLTKCVQFGSSIRPEISCLKKKLIELDIGRIVANFLAREQHLQGGEEDPAGH